jgi:hypothetical protein
MFISASLSEPEINLLLRKTRIQIGFQVDVALWNRLAVRMYTGAQSRPENFRAAVSEHLDE